MRNKSELNSRQWDLYNYLKDHGDEWIVQAQVAAEIPAYNYDGNEDFALFHDNQARHIMTADIRAINDSGVIQKIIISSGRGIKLATKEEFTKYIKSEFAAVFRKLARVRKKAKKGFNDQQYKITFGEYERNVVEAFINDKI